ncbi:MAG: hypothetical protein KTR30_11700 [Saprospiraceae bacterium]|nr:hypothetical protein [Saprospiraceae bacterium]
MKKTIISLPLGGLFLLVCLSACQSGVDTRAMEFDQLRIDKTVVDEIRLSDGQKIDAKIGARTLHEMLLEGDFLPSGWVADPPPKFYELKRVTRTGNRSLLFYAVCYEDGKIAEIKVATLEGKQLRYNYLIWSDVQYGDPYTSIQLEKEKGSIQFYHEGQLRFTYLPDEGKVEQP